MENKTVNPLPKFSPTPQTPRKLMTQAEVNELLSNYKRFWFGGGVERQCGVRPDVPREMNASSVKT
jgi:hypothetical protein